MEKVSVIIPTFNRFKFLLNTIHSVQKQTYTNIEIIVINDCSTQQEYYSFDWEANNVIIIHLRENTKKKFGYPCAAYVRNQGIKKSTGKYVAFCDDDDIWLPHKTELQLKEMKNSNSKMSSTDGYIGNGVYNKNIAYYKYNEHYYYPTLFSIYENHYSNKFIKKLKKIPFIKSIPVLKSKNLLEEGFPQIWDFNFLSIHNCMITSSVIIHKSILDKINNFKNLKPPGEDYDCWLRALKHTNSVYVNEVCFYYDLGHGDGRNYEYGSFTKR